VLVVGGWVLVGHTKYLAAISLSLLGKAVHATTDTVFFQCNRTCNDEHTLQFDVGSCVNLFR